MKKPRNPHHDIPGIQCVCKKCRIYKEYINNEKNPAQKSLTKK